MFILFRSTYSTYCIEIWFAVSSLGFCLLTVIKQYYFFHSFGHKTQLLSSSFFHKLIVCFTSFRMRVSFFETFFFHFHNNIFTTTSSVWVCVCVWVYSSKKIIIFIKIQIQNGLFCFGFLWWWFSVVKKTISSIKWKKWN